MEKLALVTGGSSGIGFATAKLLRDKGYDVYITGRDENKLRSAAGDLGINFYVADVENIKQIENISEGFLGSGLDVLVNNAGVFGAFPLEEYNLKDFSHYMDINFRGMAFFTKIFISALEKRRGAVTNVSSIITQSALPGTSMYAATKGAIEAFTRSLALELSPRNIRVNAVSPGAVDTALLGNLYKNSKEKQAAMLEFAEGIPLKRYAKAEEIAHVIVAQLQSTYTTGSIWTVDGGVSL